MDCHGLSLNKPTMFYLVIITSMEETSLSGGLGFWTFGLVLAFHLGLRGNRESDIVAPARWADSKA